MEYMYGYGLIVSDIICFIFIVLVIFILMCKMAVAIVRQIGNKSPR